MRRTGGRSVRRVDVGEQLLLWRLHRYVLVRFLGSFSSAEIREIVEVGLAAARRAAGDQYPPLTTMVDAVDRVAVGRAGRAAPAAGTTADDQLAAALFGEHATAERIRRAFVCSVAAGRADDVRIVTQYLDLAERAGGPTPPPFSDVAAALSPIDVCTVRAAIIRFCNQLLTSA